MTSLSHVTLPSRHRDRFSSASIYPRFSKESNPPKDLQGSEADLIECLQYNANIEAPPPLSWNESDEDCDAVLVARVLLRRGFRLKVSGGGAVCHESP